MSDPLTTNHLKLPYLAAAQAQKHVTHNELLTLLDTAVQLAVLDATLTAPPGSAAEGDRHIVATSATGDWTGKDGQVATWVDGMWAYAAPEPGWLAFDVGTATLLAFVSGAWQAATASVSEVDKLGINTAADDTNRLSVRSAAALFTGIAAADGGTGDMRMVMNKETDADTASLLFQSGFSGRAEIGLVGDTDIVVKVSADGSTWTEAIRVDKTTGHSTILYDNATSGLTATNVQGAIDEIAASGGGGGGAVTSVFGRTGAVVAATSDYAASQVANDSGVSGTTVKDALNTLSSGKQAASGDLAAIAGLTPANDDVVQRKAGAWTNRTPAQLKTDLAITAADIVSAVSNTEFGYLDGVTSAIQTQLNAKAALASPTLTGTPAAPTAAVDTNTTQVATTAFVLAQASASGDGTPVVDGTAARGTSTHFARADHVHPTDTSRAPLASPTFTGTPAVPTASVDTNTTQVATTAFVLAQASALGDGTPATDGTAARGTSTHFARADHVHPTDTSRAALASPTLTGTPAAPTAAVDTNTTQVATTAFVLAQASASGDGTPATDGTAARGTSTHFARADHVHPTDTSRAALASPTLTGTPAAPTAAVDTNTTQVATTAFVLAQASASGDGTPAGDGTAVRGTSTHFARTDHVHPTDTSRAALASPTLTGTPAAPTATSGTNTTQIATTAFVAAAVAALSTVYQAIAAILTAIAGLAANGLIARTGSGTVAVRTITGTANHVAVTNGDGVAGNPTLDVGSSVALLDTAAQSLSGGARVVTYDNGTKSSGTFTPDPGNGPNQKATNNGAHTLAPGTNYGAYYLDITNGASAGAITTSGWTVVDGDGFDTSTGHKFKCICTISEIGSTLTVKAMQ